MIVSLPKPLSIVTLSALFFYVIIAFATLECGIITPIAVDDRIISCVTAYHGVHAVIIDSIFAVTAVYRDIYAAVNQTCSARIPSDAVPAG